MIEELKRDESVISSPAVAKDGAVRSPVLAAFTLSLIMAGDRLHWSFYVLAAGAGLWGFIVFLGEVARHTDEYHDEVLRPAVLRREYPGERG